MYKINIIKKISVIVATGLMICGATGCGETNNQSSEAEATSTTEAPTEVTTTEATTVATTEATTEASTTEASTEAATESTEEITFDGPETYNKTEYTSNARGWRINEGCYEYYDLNTGERVMGQTIDDIEISADGDVVTDDYSRARIDTMMKARWVVEHYSSETDSIEVKREKMFNWILSKQYHRFRRISEVQGYIEIEFANDIFDNGVGDCVSESAALAFLFHEIGYNDVYFCNDTGHAWVISDGNLYDPLFAESKDFASNYNVILDSSDFRSNMRYAVKVY